MNAWLRRHGQGERSFARALKSYLTDQANRIAEAAENFPLGLTAETVAAVFQPEAEHALLMPILRRNIGGLMVMGATAELTAADEIRPRKDEPQFPSWLPPKVRQRILAALDEVADKPYWQTIQSQTQENLVEIIKQAIADGASPHRMSVLIRDQLGGFAARKIAMRIARTETTGALNAGHFAGMEDLIAEGLIVGREWVTVGDDRVRPTHQDLDGIIVGPTAPFIVGGSETPYPGHPDLPADERANCRCTILSVLDPNLYKE